jgi:hypothetical protein
MSTAVSRIFGAPLRPKVCRVATDRSTLNPEQSRRILEVEFWSPAGSGIGNPGPGATSRHPHGGGQQVRKRRAGALSHPGRSTFWPESGEVPSELGFHRYALWTSMQGRGETGANGADPHRRGEADQSA